MATPDGCGDGQAERKGRYVLSDLRLVIDKFQSVGGDSSRYHANQL
jgi:hypothetical protein